MKLTDTMLIILSEAAGRKNGAVIPPERLKGAAAEKVIAKLLAAGVVKEVPATRELPVWTRDEARGSLALVITDEGLKAIGVDPSEGEAPATGRQQKVPAGDSSRGKKPLSERPKAVPPAKASRQKMTRATGAEDKPSPRTGSKTAQLIGLLQKRGGATIETLTGNLGWLPHTTRAAITGLRKRGFSIERTRAQDGPTTYRITGEPAAIASAPSSRETRT